MNQFKDKQGVQWVSTAVASKFFRIPKPTLHSWKYNGELRQNVHYTQEKYPPRKIYWNLHALAAYLEENRSGQYAEPIKTPAKKPSAADSPKENNNIFAGGTAHFNLTKEAFDAINLAKESLKVEVQHHLNGVVVGRSTREPSTQMVCNMLLIKGAEAYLDEQAA